MKIVAIVPVRAGSKRVPHKNFKPFAGGPCLLERKLDSLLKVPEIDAIQVTSDSPTAEEIAEKKGVLFHQREPYYASSEVDNSGFFENIADTSPEDADILLYTPVTSPLLQVETISKAIQMFLQCETECDSVVTTNLIHHHLWLDGKPINYDPSKAPNSQDLPDIHAINYGVCVIRRDDQIRYRNVVGKKPEFLVLNQIESVDIDTPFDFEVAEYLYNKHH